MKRFLFFILFMGILISFGNEGWVKLYHLKQFEKELEAKNALLVRSNRELLKEIQNLKDLKYLEQYIREELGYVRADEILYEFTP